MPKKKKKQHKNFKRFPFGIVIKEWTQKKVQKAIDQQLYFFDKHQSLKNSFCILSFFVIFSLNF
jgi:hypothetical protein